MSECPVIQMSPEPLNLVGMMKSSDVGFTPRLIQLALWRDGIKRGVKPTSDDFIIPTKFKGSGDI